MYRAFGKRSLDLVAACALLPVSAPLLIFTFVTLFLTGHSRPIYRQKRLGLRGREFTIYKFKTMSDARGPDGSLLEDEARLTRIGRLLRRFSLDELPQLLNIVLGDMSIVGPRPLLPEYREFYTKEQFRRHDVRPGVTGWAQVNGRQDLPFSRRLELDLYYVDHLNLLFDLRILIATIPKVFGGSGVVLGQDVDDVDDLGLSTRLRSEHLVKGTGIHDYQRQEGDLARRRGD